jgi:hypothetical protein
MTFLCLRVIKTFVRMGRYLGYTKHVPTYFLGKGVMGLRSLCTV